MFAKKMNRMKAAFLATAIALTLSGSAAYAMPEGGSVASGSVTGLTNGTVASGGTLINTGNSLDVRLPSLCFEAKCISVEVIKD